MEINALLWIASIIGAVLFFYAVLGFDSLVNSRNKVENAWMQIEIQLNKRLDLMPNLTEIIKVSMKSEQKILKNVTDARYLLMNASSVEEKAEAEKILSEALKTLFAVAEKYPRLMINKNFLALKEEFSETEVKIDYAKQSYNENVTKFNSNIKKFPFAKLFGFKEREFFDTEEAEVPHPYEEYEKKRHVPF